METSRTQEVLIRPRLDLLSRGYGIEACSLDAIMEIDSLHSSEYGCQTLNQVSTLTSEHFLQLSRRNYSIRCPEQRWAKIMLVDVSIKSLGGGGRDDIDANLYCVLHVLQDSLSDLVTRMVDTFRHHMLV